MKGNFFSLLTTAILLFITACADEGNSSSGGSGGQGSSSWKESAVLVKEVAADEEEKFAFLIGNNGKLGIGNYAPFIAGKEQKHMWYLWGEKTTLLKPMKIDAINKETGEKITAYEAVAPKSPAPNDGADHTMPSSFAIPDPGLWRLEIYFDNKLFGDVVVRVNEQSS